MGGRVGRPPGSRRVERDYRELKRVLGLARTDASPALHRDRNIRPGCADLTERRYKSLAGHGG
ncbi:hypothetical protein PV682_15690 [Streptomyces niveiscabiei]|uniref:hypothetical protein n=1 Tax=Streptomyces niveiscabiei TaxID=164115 RepID=UPI0029A68EAC|nr:hypothetical protein [Streptomyces niveiscabiei]MDX3382901.1 hypothetical protein [Streptomyces niveiscabiei]